MGRTLQERIHDELEGCVLLALDKRDAQLFGDAKQLLDAETLMKFPAIRLDADEAGKCFATERYTASVFHLMRIMEVGLRALGASLNDPSLDPKTNPSSEKILSRGDKELQKHLADRSTEWRSDESFFFSTAQANLRAVKDAWRNSTLHVETNHNRDSAEDIWKAARAFMRHLAMKLSS
jgi:hypothetical protein